MNITISQTNEMDYTSLTDMANVKAGETRAVAS